MVIKPIAVEVKRASLNSFFTGIFVSILQIYVFTGLTMNVLGLNGQDGG
jgi:F0F1-type ATP synthase membrane subunit a